MLAYLDAIPLPLLPVIWLAILLGVAEAGRRLGMRGEAEAGMSGVVGAILALSGLLLAFTFSLASSQFSGRRETVLREANAVGTAWLRADFLGEPQRSEIRGLLREYVEIRLAAARGSNLDAALRRSEELHNLLWSKAISATTGDRPPTPLVALFVTSLNDVIDLHSDRVQIAVRTRVSPTVWGALLGVTAIGMAALGFQLGGTKTRSPWAMFALGAAFAITILLLADLDRPQQGLMRVAQTPLEELLRSMTATPPPG